MSDVPVSNSPRSGWTISFKSYRTGRRRLPSLGGGLILALLVSGCASTVTLTAPPTGASCPVDAAAPAGRPSILDPTGKVGDASARAAGPDSNNTAALLNDSFQAVRYETLFVPLVKPNFESPEVLIKEAATLAHKARAKAAVSKDHPLDPNDAAADPVETLILSKLPAWAGKPSTLLPLTANLEQIKSNADASLQKILNDTFRILDLTTRNYRQRNKLISTGQPSAGATAQASPSTDTGKDNTVASISKPEHDGLIDSLETLAGYRAFHVLTLISAAHLHQMLTDGSHPSLETLNAEVRFFNVNRFLSTYFDAYFRGGQFIQFTADQQTVANTLTADLQKKVKTGLQPAEVSKFIDDEFAKLCQGPDNTSACLPKLGQAAFVTRAGLSVQFSGISFNVTTKNGLGLSHNYPQLSQFGPQMIRVLVEAVFDANGLSATGVPNSTACLEGLFTGPDCLDPKDTEAQLALQQIDEIASTFEGLNSMATGVLIRGLNEAALNNEAVSQSIETLIGVTSRKITERVLTAASKATTCPVPVPQLKVNVTAATLTSQ